jgi:hypothetical protein
LDYQKVKAKFIVPLNILLYSMLIALPTVLCGCSTVKNTVKGVEQRFIRSMRAPGEKEVASPENTARKHACSPSTGSKFFLEETVVIPRRVSPGEEINHRIRYAFCPDETSRPLNGKIVRTILFKGDQMFQDTTHYEFKPGTWTVDVFITIPKDELEGIHTMELRVTYDNKVIKRSNTFNVTK